MGDPPHCTACLYKVQAGRFPTYLHDLQQRLSDGFQRSQRKSLPLVGARGEGPVAIAGAERYDRGRLHFADSKQQVKFGQRELSQAQP